VGRHRAAFDDAEGASAPSREIQRLVEDPLSEKLLRKEFRAGKTIIVDTRDGEIVFEGAGVPPEVRRSSSPVRRRH
jgi:ATP-dependent Clp protease ATP-binding subunit ClpA